MKKYQLTICGVALAMLTGTASACDVIHAVKYEISEGGFAMLHNGAVVHYGDEGEVGQYPLLDWLVEGENTVTIEYRGDAGGNPSTFSLEKGCRGEFETEILQEISLGKSEVKELTFINDTPVVSEYIHAQTENDVGLIEAVKAFQTAVKNGDMEYAMAVHAPMLRNFKRQGAPIESVKEHMLELLSDKNAFLSQKLSAKPIMDGLIYQVLSSDDGAPFQVTTEMNGGTLSWNTGTFWGKFDGEWAIVAR